MRKLFTSVMAALCLAAPASTLSAQNQQLTEAQKEAFKKEVMPVIFEQIKEQAGIDILGWANPSLSNTFAGIPVLESSNLRAISAEAEAISVKPDSVVLDATALGLPAIATPIIGEEIKIEFEDYSDISLPASISATPITISLPKAIVVNDGLATLTFEQTEGSTNLLDLNVHLSALSVMNYDLIGCTLGLEAANLTANVDIKDGLRELIGTLGSIPGVGITVPEGLKTDYQITVGLAGLTKGSVSATLYSVAEGSVTNITPMGTADVVLNMAENAMFPVDSMNITGYKADGTNYSTYKFSVSETTTSGNIVTKLFVDKYTRPTADGKNTFAENGRTIITARDFTPSILPLTPKAAVQSVLKDVVNQLAEGEAPNWYDLTISTANSTTAEAGTEVAYITVSPYMASTTTAIADVDVRIGGTTAPTYTIRATADLTSNKIAVDVVKEGETTPYGTAYFTSNIAGIITANESVEETVATMKVVPTENAIRVTNVDKGTYRIVSMTGAIVASGHINGDTYIPTASLSQGIYIVAVEADGVMQSVKIKR